MILLIGFAFLSGLVTILAPCIWPLLPIVLSASASGRSHKRPLGIVLGIMVSFAAFTLAVSSLVRIFHFDPNILRLGAVVVISFLGLSLLIPALSHVTEKAVSRLSGKFGLRRESQQNDFGAGFLTGLSLGIVWAPCAGPILAAIASLAVMGQVTTNLVFITIAYVIGVGIPLFGFAYGGQRVISKTRFLSKYTGRIQQIFGVVMLLTAVGIYTGYDKVLQVKLFNYFPSYSQTLNHFESSSAVKQQLDLLRGKETTNSTNTDDLFNTNVPAPELVGITNWLNTDKPLTLASLRGKVVLIDFWTYTCINCIRTLPYVTSWYDKYKDKGFVVIGVHTPEFEFEKKPENVRNAIKQYKINYPVPQDNDYATWNAFNNQYWPAKYLIDAKGNIRRTHFGEGDYDKTEMAIQALLKEAGQDVVSGLENKIDQTPKNRRSPEAYLGSRRMEFYTPGGNINNGTRQFTLATILPNDTFTLGGTWTITDENAVAGPNATLTHNFTASKVFLVLRPGKSLGKAMVKVFLDGKVVDGTSAGQDVQNGLITIDTDRLYTLIDLQGKTENHTLKLEFQTPGIEAFAFTFG